MNEARVAGTRAEDARIDARDATRVHGAMLAVTRTLIVYSTLYRYPPRCARSKWPWLSLDSALSFDDPTEIFGSTDLDNAFYETDPSVYP
jgi:hypothetical protein